MTLPRLEAIARRWQEVPPLSESARNIAEFLGAQKRSKAPAKRGQQQEAPQLADLAGAGFAGGGGKGIPQWQQDLLTK